VELEIINTFKLTDRSTELFKDVEEYFRYTNRLEEVTLMHVLILEYGMNCMRCKFEFSDDGKSVECLQEGIPSQIVYQNYYNNKSPFLKFSVKKLKDVCRYISNKLKAEMDDIMLETYKNYDDVAIKFEIDYLKATSFKFVLNYARCVKGNYVNYLDFMNATGLFEYELSHINEIHDELEEKRKSDIEKQEIRNKIFEVRDGVIKYLEDNYNIDYDTEYYNDEDYDYNERLCGDYDHYEEIFDDYDFYQEVVEQCPNKYHVYKWCIDGKDNKIFMSSIPLTPEMAIVESRVIGDLRSTNLEESIKKIEEYLKTPVEYAMTLEEYVGNGFKLL